MLVVTASFLQMLALLDDGVLRTGLLDLGMTKSEPATLAILKVAFSFTVTDMSSGIAGMHSTAQTTASLALCMVGVSSKRG